MNIIAVIVDEVPKGSVVCEYRVLSDDLCYECKVTHNRWQYNLCAGYDDKLPSYCPLITATQYGDKVWNDVIEKWDGMLRSDTTAAQYAERNAMVTAPSRSVARRTKLMRGEE